MRGLWCGDWEASSLLTFGEPGQSGRVDDEPLALSRQMAFSEVCFMHFLREIAPRWANYCASIVATGYIPKVRANGKTVVPW